MLLYVSDLDGTLLQPDATLSTFAREAIVETVRRGIPMTVASARSLTSMRQILADLPLELAVASHNGAVIGDLATGRVHEVHAIEPASASAVYEAFRLAGFLPFVTAHDGQAEHLFATEPPNAGHAAYLADRRSNQDPRLRIVDDTAIGLREQVLSITVIADRARLEPLHTTLAAIPGVQLYFFDDLYTPGWAWLTAQPRQASKGFGIQSIQRHAGSDLPTVVFGDQINDLPMFAEAHHAVAVDNAHPDVHAAADERIGPNHADAVARYLRGVEGRES